MMKPVAKLVLVGATIVLPAMAAQADTMMKCDFRKLKDAGTHGPALVTDIPKAMTPVSLNSVQVIDENIKKKIMPQAVFARRTETGTVEVMARIVNCTDYDQEVLMHTSFMDLNQMPTEPVSNWQRVFLSPRSTKVYTEKSMSIDVGYYLIEMDEGD